MTGSDTPYQRAVYLVDGSRTPFLRTSGRPGPFSASDLAVQCGRPLLLRQPFSPEHIDQLILGCVCPGPEEANIARLVALRLNCGEQVPAWTVQRNCASGMQAIDSAASLIGIGRAELILAGGTEAMSHHPVLLNRKMLAWLHAWNKTRSAIPRLRQLARLRPAHLRPVIALLKGLTDPLAGLSMGQTAELLAYEFNIDRQRMDAYALESHRRLEAALTGGRMNEIEPMIDSGGRIFAEDQGLRRDSNLQQLARLKPVFDRPVGRVTAGNSAQITDGAALLLLASANAVERYGLTPTARLVDIEWAGLDPARMGLGPVHALAGLLWRRGLTTSDIGCWEINEAFAAQVLACLEAWGDQTYFKRYWNRPAFDPIDPERLNPDGGAISLGHPVGASGARIVLHLMKTLRRRTSRFGLASLCVGGGQGGALLLERVEGIGHD